MTWSSPPLRVLPYAWFSEARWTRPMQSASAILHGSTRSRRRSTVRLGPSSQTRERTDMKALAKLERRDWRRRLTVIVVVLAFLGGIPAEGFGASPSISALRTKLADLKNEARKAGDAYSKAYWRLDKTKLQLVETDKQIAQSEQELAEATARLASHVTMMYRQGEVDYVALLLTSESLDDMLVRLG